MGNANSTFYEKDLLPGDADIAAIEALRDVWEHGYMSIAYLDNVLGKVGSTLLWSQASAATEERPRTWRGRRVLTEEEMAQKECPYPYEPDL